jgi:hypothetical protein
MKITEHLLFLALMIPTLVVLAAAAVSLAHSDPDCAKPTHPGTTASAAFYPVDEAEYDVRL